MAKGRIVRFKYGNGNHDLRVTLEQARAVKQAMLDHKADKLANPCMTIDSDLDGEWFGEIAAIWGIGIDHSPQYTSVDEII